MSRLGTEKHCWAAIELPLPPQSAARTCTAGARCASVPAAAAPGELSPSCMCVRTTSAGCVMIVAATAATVPLAKLVAKEGHCWPLSRSCRARRGGWGLALP